MNDDILISRKSDQEHLQHLEKVILIQLKYEIKLKKAKGVFFSKGVTYLEFQINEHRVFPVKEQIEDMLLNTKPPRNVIQLK